ncbi:hypothetical protein OIO90_001645 [Microbotryomycetes sp. JL221]|nr:hypothetical protein OIO90_001645 [Microbotryomycetes sp. JL221]
MSTNVDEGDTALQTLVGIFPDHDVALLQRFLVASHHNVERACTALLTGDKALFTHSTRRSKLKRKRVEPRLDAWLGSQRNSDDDGEIGGTRNHETKSMMKQRRVTVSNNQPQDQVKSAFAMLRDPSTCRSETSTQTLTTTPQLTNLPVLRLTNSDMIRQHTKDLITLVPNVLPTELANRLFQTMIEESRGSKDKPGWERNRWYMFDREVVSPHTTSFYVSAPDPLDKTNEESELTSKEQQGELFAQAATHWYNGEVRSSRPFTNEMNEARQVIASLVQTVLKGRKKHALEWQGEWVPNVSAANCYTGKDEGVGWHSDVLTHLGPFPTIASLSLGVVKKCLNIQFHLSTQWICLDYQERIRLFENESIPDFAPLDSTISQLSMKHGYIRNPEYVGTPLCQCGVPTVLRPDGKGRAKANLRSKQITDPVERNEMKKTEDENELLFFWTCSFGQQNQGKTCGFFKLLNMRKEGRGQYFQVEGSPSRQGTIL